MAISNDHFKELLHNEIGKLEEVRDISRSIQDSLNKETDSFDNDILSVKGNLLQEILEIEECIGDGLESEGKDISSFKVQFSTELGRIQKLLEEIQQSEKVIYQELTKRKEKLVKELDQLRLGQFLPEQYRRHEHGGSSFVNIRE